MARIRTIKPEIWTDEKFVSLSPLARLLFIGLWNFADDEGRMEYSPIRIKLQILPADSQDISGLIGEIRGNSMVELYTESRRIPPTSAELPEDAVFLRIINFSKHQKVDKRQASKLPPPPNPPEPPRIPPPEWNGMDQGREGIKEGKKPQAPPNGSLALPEWVPERTWRDFEAMRKKIKKPLTDGAKELAVKELDKLRAQGHDPQAVLEQSILNAWQGLFPLRSGNGGQVRSKFDGVVG